MKKLTKHHRRPRKLRGNGNPENISWISDKKHRAWHTLFNHNDALAIAKNLIMWGIINRRIRVRVLNPDIAISDYPQFFGTIYPYKNTDAIYIPLPKGIRIGSLEMTKTRKEAVKTLFGQMSDEEIIQEINDLYLDPNYKFELEE